MQLNDIVENLMYLHIRGEEKIAPRATHKKGGSGRTYADSCGGFGVIIYFHRS